MQDRLLIVRDARNLGQSARRVFYCINPIVQALQFVALFFILRAQTLVLMFDSQMLCFLRQAIKTIGQPAQHG